MYLVKINHLYIDLHQIESVTTVLPGASTLLPYYFSINTRSKHSYDIYIDDEKRINDVLKNLLSLLSGSQGEIEEL